MPKINTIILRFLFSLLTVFFLCHCSKVKQVVRGGLIDPAINESAATTLASTYVFATDYNSSGQLYLAVLTNDGATLVNSGVTLLGSSAIIKNFDNLIYVLHDGFSTVSTDNIQIIDPANDFNTLAQFSVGNGTNPHDIAVTGSRAFVALYNPTADPLNVDSQGRPADVIEVDLDSGNIVNRWSFWEDLEDDGDRNGNAEKLLLLGNTLYVALQDLSSNTFQANSNGIIGRINITTGEKLPPIVLSGRNPISLAATPDASTLYVANMASYSFTLSDFDLIPPYGGLEVVDLESGTSLGLLADEDLGGYVERITGNATHVYAVVSAFDAADFSYASKVVRLLHDFDSVDEMETVDDSGTDIRELAISGDYLWVSRRQINTSTGIAEPQLDILNLATFEQAADSLFPAAPGMSMAAP